MDRRIYMLPMRDLQGLARLMRLEMLDMMKVPCKLYNELGVRRGTSRGGDRYPPKSDPNLNNFRIFEYLAEHLKRESDYSSTYLPSGPGWNAASVLLNIIAGGEHRTMTFDSVGIDLVQKSLYDGYSKVINVTDMIKNHICGNLDYVLRSLSWMLVDPGRQYVTGSFHPLKYDWYAQALAVEEYEPTLHREDADMDLEYEERIRGKYRRRFRGDYNSDHKKSARYCARLAFEENLWKAIEEKSKTITNGNNNITKKKK